ncbi:MAG: hypothetical protein J2P31_20855, partial [Blastocatellia bacterium]|nr:hypothetical protein [Blastocatellia bacterium]
MTSSEKPDATSSGSQPRRRLRLKRTLKILTAVFLFIAFLVFAAWVYLRSEAFNRLVADQLQSKLKEYGLRGEIGGTKISLKNQTARLSNLKIFNDQTGQLIASARLIELDVDLREPYAIKLSREIVLKRLNLEGLDFNLEIDEKGGTNLRGLRSVQAKEGGRITLDYSQLLATISDSSIHLKDRANKFGTDLSGIRITARPRLTNNFNVALQLETAGGRFSFQNRETAIDRLGMTGT